MTQLSLAQRVRFARDDIGRALRFLFRPWIDLPAVKTTHVDVVNMVSACQADIAQMTVSLEMLRRRLADLEARATEQEIRMRRLPETREQEREP